jgi:hypothetical protein
MKRCVDFDACEAVAVQSVGTHHGMICSERSERFGPLSHGLYKHFILSKVEVRLQVA